MTLIDRDELLKKFLSGALLFQPDVRKIIEDEPEAIVHCKDCRRWLARESECQRSENYKEWNKQPADMFCGKEKRIVNE